jgi:hypothetical protein
MACETEGRDIPKYRANYLPDRLRFVSAPIVHLPYLLFQKALDLFLFGQFELVLGDEQIIVHAGDGVLHQGVVLLRAEQDADRRVVVVGHHVFPVPAHIRVELAQVSVGERLDLQLHQHVAFENAMIEDQVHKAVGVADQDALLPRLETEAVAQLQQKVMQLVQERVFQIGFTHDLTGLNPEKLEDVWVANGQLWFGLIGPGPDHFCQFLLVHGQAGTLVVEAAYPAV